MERIVHKSLSFNEAEEWDIRQQLMMKPEERQRAAKELRIRIFGDKPDIREFHRKT